MHYFCLQFVPETTTPKRRLPRNPRRPPRQQRRPQTTCLGTRQSCGGACRTKTWSTCNWVATRCRRLTAASPSPAGTSRTCRSTCPSCGAAWPPPPPAAPLPAAPHPSPATPSLRICHLTCQNCVGGSCGPPPPSSPRPPTRACSAPLPTATQQVRTLNYCTTQHQIFSLMHAPTSL